MLEKGFDDTFLEALLGRLTTVVMVKGLLAYEYPLVVSEIVIETDARQYVIITHMTMDHIVSNT